MRVAYITGVSKGLGEATANRFLAEGWNVVGLGRKHTIEHTRYTAVFLDLEQQEIPEIPIFPEAFELLWVNNAAIVGKIGYLGTAAQDAPSIFTTIQVNLSAALALSHRVIQLYEGFRGRFTLLNISSGAGRNAYPSWAAYCASKAGMDMFSRVLDAEWKTLGKDNFRVFSMAPGIIDTGMQVQIRQAKPDDFPLLERFKNYHAEGALESPDLVAEKLFYFVKRSDAFSEVLIDLRLI